MSPTPRRLGAWLTAVIALMPVMAGGAKAAVVEPNLGLRSASTYYEVRPYENEPVYFDIGIFLEAREAPFELLFTRPDYTQPIQVTQILHDPLGGTESKPLPDLEVEWGGIPAFFDIEIRNAEGDIVEESTMDFCPGGYGRERVNDEGPVRSAYPEGCFTNPFTRGMVYGIDQNWAVNIFGYNAPYIDIPKGMYDVTISVVPEYAEMFGMQPDGSSISVDVKVRKPIRFDCDKCPRGRTSERVQARASQSVPTMEDPDPAILPDLAALPAWGIYVDNRPNKSFLSFGATVWTDGASSMVVEGFRRSDVDIMDAYQYFYVDGDPIGRAQVGEMEYDERRGHQHWHFLQFAKYSLLDSTQSEIVISKKEAFCLAPTDAIDLALPDAVLNPGEIGLGTACGSRNSIWTRETLPLGWGDTYQQSLPGQSFNITSLANGTYYIAVEANPTGSLYEQTDANNVELREIVLSGKPGNRKVTVPPWNGIDSESIFGPGKGF
jgi:hypothetical protein